MTKHRPGRYNKTRVCNFSYRNEMNAGTTILNASESRFTESETEYVWHANENVCSLLKTSAVLISK